MHLRFRKALFILAGVSLLAVLLAAVSATSRFVINRRTLSEKPADQIPRVILWAWERPTDLSFVNPRQVAVAFLARTILLRGNEVIIRPRLQSLSLPEATTVIAVARVESDRANRPGLSAEQRDALSSAIAEMSSLPKVVSIQIDFDATKTERAFYREVIKEVRKRLPQRAGLSITALASWCMDDDWLSDLPIDEAVPMLFRMGADSKQIAARIDTGDDFASTRCRHSYGISTDEPHPQLSSSRRVYIFSPNPWTDNSVRTILESTK